MLIEKVIDSCVKILREDLQGFSKLAAGRLRTETKLQELIHSELQLEIPGIERERPYPDSKGKCDFWYRMHDDTESWVELKLCPTNYCSDFGDVRKSLPITQQISHVILDCEKLSRLNPRYERGVVVLAYPMPLGEEHSNWESHTNRIRNTARSMTREFQIELVHKTQTAAVSGYRIDV